MTITVEHEKIAREIHSNISSAGYAGQQQMRRFFTNPYRLVEYDFVLLMLKNHEVVSHLPNDNLIPGKNFLKYTTFEDLVKNKQSSAVSISAEKISNIVVGDNYGSLKQNSKVTNGKKERTIKGVIISIIVTLVAALILKYFFDIG